MRRKALFLFALLLSYTSGGWAPPIDLDSADD